MARLRDRPLRDGHYVECYANLDATDIAALASSTGVTVVDRVSEISAIMAKYRVIAGQLLAAAYTLASLLMCLRYGVRRGVRILVVPLAPHRSPWQR